MCITINLVKIFVKIMKQNVVYLMFYLYLYSIITEKKHQFFDIIGFSHLLYINSAIA